MSPVVWPSRAARAWRPPTSQTLDEWAESTIRLPQAEAAEAGPLRMSRTPYMRGILRAAGDPAVRQVTVMASTQVGKTTCELVFICYAIDQDPGRAIWVMPREADAEYMVDRRLKPMIEASPLLARHITGRKKDWKKDLIVLNGMEIYPAWAGSEASVASKPCAYVVLDELSIFDVVGDMGDPVDSARERTRTYPFSKLIAVSTPKYPDDLIVREWDSSTKEHHHVACPSCGVYQTLEFDRDRVVWPAEERDPERIRTLRLARYTCVSCRADIRDEDKARMLASGVWCPEGCTVDADGAIVGEQPRSSHRGFHLNALYSTWLTFSDVAAKFLECHRKSDLRSFYNFWLGLPFQEVIAAPETAAARLCARGYERGSVPDEVIALTAGIDVGDYGLHWSIHGWGDGMECWMIECGVATSWAELEELIFRHRWPRVEPGATPAPVLLALVDMRHDQESVLRFCYRNRERAEPCEGYDTLPGFISVKALAKSRLRRKSTVDVTGMWKVGVNTDHYKTTLMRRLRDAGDGLGAYHVPQNVPEEFLSHLTSEEVQFQRQKNGVKKRSWVKTAGPNHWLDTTVYGFAAAERLLLPVRLLRKGDGDATTKPRIRADGAGSGERAGDGPHARAGGLGGHDRRRIARDRRKGILDGYRSWVDQGRG